MNAPFSPIAHQASAAPASIKSVLSHPTHLQKIGVKGPGLVPWSQTHNIPVPTDLYETRPVGQDGVMARVGSNEAILECAASEPLFAHMEEGLLAADTRIYRIEQQSLTLLLHGDAALAVLAQTCGVDFAAAPPDRMVYTRVAGASCAVLPHSATGQPAFRLWIDYTLAPYLWETLAQIAADVSL